MASFTDLIAQCIRAQHNELMAGLSLHPNDDVEHELSTGIQAHWHAFSAGNAVSKELSQLRIGAVDGSRAVRSLNVGADWIVAQALLIGPDGWRDAEGNTRIIRGDVAHPEIDRYASLLMRSLELNLALRFVQQKRGNVLLLDGSLYSDLPYLLYNLAIGGHEDLPRQILEQYLDLFELCQQSETLLLGIAKSTRSTLLGRALLQVDASPAGLPSDGELLYRWTEGCGLTNPLLLGSASFGQTSAHQIAQLATKAKQAIAHSNVSDLSQDHLSQLQKKLLAAPAIGTFYARLAPGDDVLRIDALASSFGHNEHRLLEFNHQFIEYEAALPILEHLLGEYGGFSVYNAALYVVDQEVRLRTETVDKIYLPILRSQLGSHIQYDRSTRRFFS